ncbi:MAG: MgtC/SapB family protein [Gemmataceae bacterium]
MLGLTTAAGLYFTTAIGVAAGMGHEVTAVLGTLLSFIIIRFLPYVEDWLPLPKRHEEGVPEPRATSQALDIVDLKKAANGDPNAKTNK